MNSGYKINSIRAVVAVAAVLAALACTMPAQADDPIFPVGSRIGLVPPAGMVTSRTFQGFEDADKKSAILFTTLPSAAYSEMEKTVIADVLKREGISVDKREPVQLNVGKGFLITGKQVNEKTHYRKWLLVTQAGDLTALLSAQVPEKETAYSDSMVRAAFATLTVRATVPDEERLSLLPFSVGELAGFHIDDVLPGRALMLVDTPAGGLDARLLVAALQGGPAEPNDRANFARLAFEEIGGIKDVRITMSEPLRIGGQQGFQTMAQAKDSRTNTDVMVVQWLRFGGGGFLQMIGIARAEVWSDLLTRLRAVRDSIEPR